MSDIFDLPSNPVELAAERAEMTVGQDFDINTEDNAMIEALENEATHLGFLDKKYYLSAFTGFQIPVDFQNSDMITYTKFDGLSAEALLCTYAKFHIGRIIGGGAVRAVCLCFSEGFVLNRFTEIPNDQLLFVPVLAINEIVESA